MRTTTVSPSGWPGASATRPTTGVGMDRSGADPMRPKPDGNRTEEQAHLDRDLGERVERALESVNRAVQIFDRRIRFERHAGTGRIMCRVINAETEEVVREIPPEELLDAMAQMLECLGLVVDEWA